MKYIVVILIALTIGWGVGFKEAQKYYITYDEIAEMSINENGYYEIHIKDMEYLKFERIENIVNGGY